MFDDVKKEHKVFSAHAEVVPFRSDPAVAPHRILRARGGSSTKYARVSIDSRYSPRTRR